MIKERRLIASFCFVSFLFLLLILFLPLFSFQSALYTKRSANTFVGDEKYLAVRAEIESEAAAYQEKGIETTISEQVTERTNSKGKKTSMVAFSLLSTDIRSGWQLLASPFACGRILFLCLILFGILLLFLCLGLVTAGGTAVRKFKPFHHFLLDIPIAASVLLLFCVPAFALSLNLTFGRNVTLALSQNLPESDSTALFSGLDQFLFGGIAGDKLPDMLGTFSFRLNPVYWCLLAPVVITLVCTLKLRFGQIRRPFLRLLLYLTVVAFSLFILYPFFVMFITAFRSNAETTDMYFLHVLPTKWIWSNLKDTLERGVLRYLINSLLIAGGATAIAMLCGIPAAYAMARMNFRAKKAYLGFIIMSQMFSPVVLLVGISRLMNTLHLNDSLIGLMFINAAFNQAFAIWLLRGTFVSISSEMEQAACIDGCSTLSALLRILIPIASPGIVTTLIFVFINSWNEYTISTVLISTQTNRPITVGITQFSSFNMIEWQYLFAAALLATVPVVILFMLIEKHLAAGLTAGGVKG